MPSFWAPCAFASTDMTRTQSSLAVLPLHHCNNPSRTTHRDPCLSSPLSILPFLTGTHLDAGMMLFRNIMSIHSHPCVHPLTPFPFITPPFSSYQLSRMPFSSSSPVPAAAAVTAAEEELYSLFPGQQPEQQPPPLGRPTPRPTRQKWPPRWQLSSR